MEPLRASIYAAQRFRESILEEEEVFGEDLLVLQIGEKSIKVFRKEEIIHIETDDGGQE